MQVSLGFSQDPCHDKVLAIHFLVGIAERDEIAHLGLLCQICGLEKSGVFDELEIKELGRRPLDIPSPSANDMSPPLPPFPCQVQPPCLCIFASIDSRQRLNG
jgi:hypothetical protein